MVKFKKNIYLLALLLIFLLLDLVLIYIIVTRNSSFLPSPVLRSLNIKGPDFITSNPQFIFKQGEVKIFEGDINNGLSASITIKGTVKNKPTFNSSLRSFELPVIITTKNGSRLTANLLLGDKNNKILIHKAPDGVILGETTIISTPVTKLEKLIKVGTPIIADVYYDKEIKKFAYSKPTCNEDCKKNIKFITDYTSHTESFLEVLNNKSQRDVSIIGPVGQLLIYVK